MKTHHQCSFCHSEGKREGPPPVVSEEERAELLRQYLEAKELLTELNRVSPRWSKKRHRLPQLLLAFIAGRDTFTARDFRRTEEGKRFRIQHVWRTLDHWVKAGHVERVGKGVYRRSVEGVGESETPRKEAQGRIPEPPGDILCAEDAGGTEGLDG